IVQITHPEQSYAVLETMKNHVAQLVSSLGMPFRILKLCGGDMGFASALTYDFEIWSAGQNRWLEISSVSNFESFQTNRLRLRFKEKETGKNRLAHSLNGSALALPRILAALLEYYQEDDGIRIPDALLTPNSKSIRRYWAARSQCGLERCISSAFGSDRKTTSLSAGPLPSGTDACGRFGKRTSC
ncbi:MAG: hypothetical protein EBZ62_06560, partial [Sphingobacteriia bacterium]|nr:hypothetical protein [Sphingobacteriia bacterium]